MQIVLWNTRRRETAKDLAAGFGVGLLPSRTGWRGRLLRLLTRDHPPAPLVFAYLSAIFRRLGHDVRYVEDRLLPRADLYVFCPSLATIPQERRAMARLLGQAGSPRVLVVGMVATMVPEAFAGLDVTLVQGEPEQLLWRFDEVLDHPGRSVDLGRVEDLDRLPPPDWSSLDAGRFRVASEFWKFPTALVEQSRGCVFRCSYCPYTIRQSSVRFRSPQSVAEEIRLDLERYGFRSFKFRDPLFGQSRSRLYQLAELLGRLPRKIQFSIETRTDLLRPEMLRVLKRVGLTSVRVGIETPDQQMQVRHGRVPVDDDRQRDFVALCRGMGIRTAAGFLLGFPDDTETSIRGLLDYATQLNPTRAEFHILRPYPGTRFFDEIQPRTVHGDVAVPAARADGTTAPQEFSGQALTPEQLETLQGECFERFYGRWQYLQANAHLLWPGLARLGIGREPEATADGTPAHAGPPRPLSGQDLLSRRRRHLRADGPHTRW
jgi:radical SAM superfamily enzyme YgiQ (UPF0313 family)